MHKMYMDRKTLTTTGLEINVLHITVKSGTNQRPVLKWRWRLTKKSHDTGKDSPRKRFYREPQLREEGEVSGIFGT